MSIEKFIKEHRQSFDTKEPSANLWSKIETGLDESKPRSIKPWAIAASVVILISLGFVLGRYAQPASQHSEVMKISPSYGTQLIQFTSQVDRKIKTLDQYDYKNPSLKGQFERDILELQNDFEALKEQLPNNPNQEILLKEMVRNLQWQLNLLDHQIHLLKKTDEDNDVVEKTEVNYELV